MKRGIVAAAIALGLAVPAGSQAASGHLCRTYAGTRAWTSSHVSCAFASNVVYFYEGMVYHGNCGRRSGCNLGPVYSRTTGRSYRVFCQPRRTGPTVSCWIIGERSSAWLDVPIRRIVATGN